MAFILIALSCACSFGLMAAESVAEPPPDRGQLEFFEKNIWPVLVAKCYECHSAEAKKS